MGGDMLVLVTGHIQILYSCFFFVVKWWCGTLIQLFKLFRGRFI